MGILQMYMPGYADARLHIDGDLYMSQGRGHVQNTCPHHTAAVWTPRFVHNNAVCHDGGTYGILGIALGEEIISIIIEVMNAIYILWIT